MAAGLFTVDGDTLTGLTQAFASPNVLGSGASTLTVTVYTLNDGNAGKDYTVTLQSASGTINPDAFTYTIGSDNQTYGGRGYNLAADLPATIATGVHGENLAITYSSLAATNAAAPTSRPIPSPLRSQTAPASCRTTT